SGTDRISTKSFRKTRGSTTTSTNSPVSTAICPTSSPSAPTGSPAAKASMPISSVGNSARRGVTLIEMLVVVAIIGIMLAVVSPSISAGLDAIRMTSATTSVAAFLNAAVNRAERRQIAVEVAISFRDNKLTMYSNEAGFQPELKLPDGILIEAVLPRTDDD